MSLGISLDVTGCGSATITVDYAPYDTKVEVKVDGVSVKTFTHVPTDSGPRIVESFTIPHAAGAIHVEGIETQADGQSFGGHIADGVITACAEVTTTTIVATTTPTTPPPTNTAATTSTTRVDSTTSTVVTTTRVPTTNTAGTTSPPTTANTGEKTVSTLVITGSSDGVLVAAGSGFLITGVAALALARRRFAR